MRYFVLATDYDGTLATDGRVHDETLTALERLRASGRKLILVTIEKRPHISAGESRAAIKEAIAQRYTLPA